MTSLEIEDQNVGFYLKISLSSLQVGVNVFQAKRLNMKWALQ